MIRALTFFCVQAAASHQKWRLPILFMTQIWQAISISKFSFYRAKIDCKCWLKFKRLLCLHWINCSTIQSEKIKFLILSQFWLDSDMKQKFHIDIHHKIFRCASTPRLLCVPYNISLAINSVQQSNLINVTGSTSVPLLLTRDTLVVKLGYKSERLHRYYTELSK